MNITFLIGNGFDLNLGLKTSYKDFLEDYANKNSNSNDSIMKFKDFIDKKQIKKEILWVDAEKEFLDYSNKFDGEKASVGDYSRCHLDICASLGKYLEQEEKRLNFEINRSDVGFAEAIHLEHLLSTLPPAEQESLDIYKSNIGGGYTYNFLSFNYTRTIDKFLSLIDGKNLLGERKISFNQSQTNTIGKLLHVHGYTDQYMVFGGNDESQIGNISLFDNEPRYKQQFIKRETNHLYQQGSDNKAYDILKQSDLIYIYGMSIGETDAIWWERICRLLSEKNNLRVIIHVHKFFDVNPAPIEWCFFMDDFKNQFISFCNLNVILKERVKNKIYVTNGNVFRQLENLANNAVDFTTISKDNVEDPLVLGNGVITNKDFVESYQRVLGEENTIN